MTTPAESFEIAMDDTAERAERESAIDALEAANECDSLETIVERDDIDDELRELSLDALAGPQCEATLADIVERDELPQELGERATSLLDDTEEIGPQ